ncbi:hypothetical protein [Bradyrhizobium sp. AUGA SZCCT0182]|uniref:hypothetical protein n=1 Tax=Bradyrhizobium sp. AUGA SZCCT0182 TaxID=2807667 RepID=UPI001BAA7BDD|nr:hypothetical protein [Bradyrhizobium sp. AUGA SZCCT0182]MBR1236192.1 hypothetical protein [Bradyrhizobium sp. AUGA SZCCT0182]
MVDDLEPFESPRILIDGAKEGISKFEAGCRIFVSACEYTVIDYEEPSSGDKVRKLRFQQRIPGSLRHTAYSILNDLRHALDQAVCDGAIFLGRVDGSGLHFPFAKSLADFDREAKARLKGVNPELSAYIKGHNAYYGGDTELYAFGSLSGPNRR